MASLEQLNKKLKSVELTCQLTNAMKTVSSAKYSKIGKMYLGYKKYSEKLEALSVYCDFSAPTYIKSDDNSNDCFLVIGHNRGFCGAYNAELHAFADNILKDNPNSLVIACGKKVIMFLENRGYKLQEKYVLPDIPDYSSCKQMIDTLYYLYCEGKVKSISVIYKKYINTLNQKTVTEQLLPLEIKNEGINAPEALFIPDKKTVSTDLEAKIVKSKFYSIILSAAISAQASTLLAMRTAVDHANETTEVLKKEIHKKRQSSITSGVIETSSNQTEEEV